MQPRSELYEYLPLEDPSHIRILHLRQQDDDRDDFQCLIEHVSISEANFSALSYAWGSPEKPYRMRVVDQNGEAMGYVPLTMSLRNALKDLRNCDYIESKTFWIDQICINQENDKERGHQVAMMGRIYKTAGQVITYLGPEEQYDQEAIDFIMKTYHRFEKRFELLDSQLLTREMIDKVREEAPIDMDIATRTVPSLEAILYGPWTKRLWMVQENTCNKDTIMLKGTNTLIWSAVAVVANLFSVRADDAILSGNLRLFTTITAMRLARFRQTMSEPDAPSRGVNELGDLMFFFKDTCYSDKRDLVYALLALACDTEQLGIEADYSKSIEQVFTETTIRIIEVHQSFWYPSLCFQKLSVSKMGTAPSWVPSFESQPQSAYDQISDQDPSAGRAAQFKLENSNSFLVIRGLIIGRARTIIALNDKSLLSIVNDDRKDLVVEEAVKLKQAVAKVREHLEENDKTDSILGCTFLQDSAFEQGVHKNHPRLTTLFRCFLLWVETAFPLAEQTVSLSDRESHSSLINTVEINRIVRKVDVEFLQGDEFSEKWKAFLNQTKGTAGRNLCITDRKDLGLVLDSTEPGDVVVIFLGGKAAHILRPVGDMYRLIGDAFFHGFMNGEAFKDSNWEQKLVDFRIM